MNSTKDNTHVGIVFIQRESLSSKKYLPWRTPTDKLERFYFLCNNKEVQIKYLNLKWKYKLNVKFNMEVQIKY